MSKNINEENLKQNSLMNRITSFLNKRAILSILIALVIAISFSDPVIGEVSTISIVTDSSWKCLDAEVRGWTLVNFDDSWWEDAEVVSHDSKDGIGNARPIWNPGTPKPQTAYFRKNFEIEGVEIISGRIYVAVYAYNSALDNYVYIYVNDDYVGKVRGDWGVWETPYEEFNIAPYLNTGKNVIAVKAMFEGRPGSYYWWALTGTIRYGTTPLTPTGPTQTPTPIQTPAPVVSSTPIPTLNPEEPYVHLYGHKTNVIVGEEVILYLSVINPITSPGTLKVQLTLQVPSGWSITSGEFSPPVGGFQTAVYDIDQGSDTKTIGIHMLANQPFDGVITGYTDYYFVEQSEPKYHKEANEPVTARQMKPSASAPSLPAVIPDGGITTEVKSVIIAIVVATIGGVLARAIWSSIKKRREY